MEWIAKAELKSVILLAFHIILMKTGSDTWKEYGLVARMLKACKDTVLDMLVSSDTYFYEYTLSWSLWCFR